MAALALLSLPFPLPPSLTELSSASELRLGQCSTQRTPFHTTSPTVAKKTQPITLEYQWHGHPPFCAPQGLWVSCSAACAGPAIWFHRWKCLTLRAQTWASCFPSCWFLCGLSWQWAKAEVRSVVWLSVKKATWTVFIMISRKMKHSENFKSLVCVKKVKLVNPGL